MSNTNSQEIAQTIAQQLGGIRKLSMMVGAKNFVALESGLTFKLGKGAKNGITHVTVKLEADDTYTVNFQRVWGHKVTEKGSFPGAYNDQLVSLFESTTGFYLSF
tara:strand:+ start:3605 stop:3919 length:315 start_codon:yes stop_codon:yes gene_type:complete